MYRERERGERERKREKEREPRMADRERGPNCGIWDHFESIQHIHMTERERLKPKEMGSLRLWASSGS